MQFEFSTASKIIFGSGTLNSIGEHLYGLGDQVLVISAAPDEINDRLRYLQNSREITYRIIKTYGEPTVETIGNTLTVAHQFAPQVVIGIGGGSAIDTAKAVAVLLQNSGEITDYLEVIGQNKPLSSPGLPLIAVPTTAGTGSEVTRNAVIGSPGHRVKVSLRSPYLLPRIALVDPSLTLSLPPDVTASTGLDALTQLIEPFTCSSPNPVTDALCTEGIKRIAHSLEKAYDDGSDLQAREDMSLASLLSGMALANAKLGAVHGLAGPIGGEITAPHGVICARLLPYALEANINALNNRAPGDSSLPRFQIIGALLTGNKDASPQDATRWILDISNHMNVKSLSAFGLSEEHFPTIIEKAARASSMKGNPITLSSDELRNILMRSI